MSKEIPPIQKYMTCNPHFITAEKTIIEAQDLMKKYSIRHLPVLHEGNIVGIISDRDLKLAMSLIQADSLVKVGYISHEHVYQVEPDSPIDRVAQVMAEKHYGCAVVVQNNKLVGIFTTVDACRALSDISRQKFHHN